MPVAPILVDQSYVLHEKLGQGGMATVHRATQRVNGLEVALKLIGAGQLRHGPEDVEEPEGPDKDLRKQRLVLAREFQTLASLHHPNIIRVQSYGFDSELGPYYTMELLDNPQTIVQAAKDRPLREKVFLIVQLLHAILYLHRRGILHRDIKPSNILVARGEVKVLDFGIAVAAAKEAETAGTLEYMAPELFCGKPPSIASDLYAVGVVAYQIMMGQFPYSRESTTKMLADLLGPAAEMTLSLDISNLIAGSTSRDSEEPVRAEPLTAEDGGSEKVAVLEGPIGDVVTRLLSRRPEDRYGDAAEVLRDLSAALGEKLPLETEKTRESFLQATELVGRQAELSRLTAALVQSGAGHGKSFLIGGESGVGKSRLLSELRTLALVRGFWVAEGQCVAKGSGPYQAWLSVLRVLSLHPELTSEEASILKALLPDISFLIGQQVADPPPVQAQVAQSRLYAVLERLLSRQRKPGLILIEDLQWVRSESAALLQHLSRLAKRLPLLIVASYRSEESPQLDRQFPEMTELRLSRLDRQSVAELSAAMLGAVGEQPALIDYLCAQTSGNAFFLVEVVRALAESAGEIQSIGQGSLPATVHTGGIERLIERRIRSVSKVNGQLLQAAALLGMRIDLSVMQFLFARVDLEPWLIDCANAAILESKGSDFYFANEKLRQAFIAQLDGDSRKQLHGRLARAIESVYADTGGGLQAQGDALAYHYQQAGVHDRALHYFMQGGESAVRLGAYTEARSRYVAALEMLEMLPDSPFYRRAKIDALLRLVQTGALTAKKEDNILRLELAQELLDSLKDAGKGAELLPAEDRLRMARIHSQYGNLYYYLGQTAEAISHFKRVLPVAQEFGDEELLAVPAYMLGVGMAVRGYTKQAEPLLAQAILPLSRYGNLPEWMRAVLYYGHALMAKGNYQAGLAEIDKAHARAVELNTPELIIMSYTVRCSFFRTAGDWPATLHCGEKALELAERLGNPIYAVVVHSYMAWAQSYLGELEKAAENRAATQKIAAAMGNRMLLASWFEAGDCEIAFHAARYAENVLRAETLLPRLKSEGEFLAEMVAARSIAFSQAMLENSDPTERIFACVQALKSTGNLLEATRTHRFWGQFYARRGDAARARHHFETMIAELAATGCVYAQAEAQRLVDDAVLFKAG